MPYKVIAAGQTDTGLVRQNNEDFWARLPHDNFFVIADGMGGHQAGEVASKEAVRLLCRSFEKAINQGKLTSSEEIRHILIKLIEDVNSKICQLGKEDQFLRGMGTTLCCVYVFDSKIVYGHVGDSRIYRLRNKNLEALTRDDSLFRELVDMGELGEADAEDFLYKNIITKAIGLEAHLEPTLQQDDIESGDIILMCTDGLTDMLSTQEIKQILYHSLVTERASTEEATKALVSAANKKGGIDNVTVVVIQLQEVRESKNLPR